MTDIARLLAANQDYAKAHPRVTGPRPARGLAVLTCMDTRIDVLAALGLDLGEAVVIRNAGGRVTEDVLRSLAVACHVLGVDTVVAMQHTKCGLSGVTDEELQARTGSNLEFLPIASHDAALRHDIDTLATTPYLDPIQLVGGFLYDVDSGAIEEMVRWERPA